MNNRTMRYRSCPWPAQLWPCSSACHGPWPTMPPRCCPRASWISQAASLETIGHFSDRRSAPSWTRSTGNCAIAQRRLDQPQTTDDARRSAADRGAAATERLLHLVKASPQLIRVDFTSAPPALKPAGLIELPGDNGVFLFEVVSGGEGLSFVTTVFDLSQSGGESTLMKLDVATNGTTYVVVELRAPSLWSNLAERPVSSVRAGQRSISRWS